MVRRAHAIGFAILLVCLAGVVGSASGLSPRSATGPAATAGADTPGDFGAASDRFARTTFEMRVYANGSVRWTTRYAKPLNESEVGEFEAFAREFNTTETDLYGSFTDRAAALASVGTNRTDRTMEARAFDRRAFVDRSALNLGTQGKVEMSFVLTNLAQVDGQRVVLGDVFAGGLYLQPSQELVVRPVEGLAFGQVDPDPDSMSVPGSLGDSDSVTWEGERDFNDGRPFVVLVPSSATGTVTATATPTTPGAETTTSEGAIVEVTTTVGNGSSGAPPETTPADAGGESGGTMLVVGLIVVLLGVGTVAVWRVTNRDVDGGAVPTPDDGTETPPPAEAPGQAATAGEATPQSAPEEELLTDSDRVRQLLDEHGGRMRQSAIVEETDWSKSKVSMLLSEMEDNDDISKLRVGRENIISLPGHEPDAAGSPFDDEE